MSDSVDKIKELYNNGYRCIKYEDHENGEFAAYFKNFENERSDSVFSDNLDEVSEIKNFIDGNAPLY